MLDYIHTHTPKQDMFFKPYTQRFHIYYDHKEGKNNYYITHDFGKITRLIDENVILEGCDITNILFDSTSATIYISKGRIIINDTYIEILDDSVIVFEQLNMFDDSGFIVLSASFINNHHLRKIQLRYHLTYFDRNHKSYGLFNTDKDKIVIGVFDFEKNSLNNVISFTQRDIDHIILDDVYYDVKRAIKLVSYFLIDGGILNICDDEVGNLIRLQFADTNVEYVDSEYVEGGYTWL